MDNMLIMGKVALKYHLPSTEKIIKEEKIQICLPSLCVLSWRFVNIWFVLYNIRDTFPPSVAHLSIIPVWCSLGAPSDIGDTRSCFTCRFTTQDGVCNHTQTCAETQVCISCIYGIFIKRSAFKGDFGYIPRGACIPAAGNWESCLGPIFQPFPNSHQNSF